MTVRGRPFPRLAWAWLLALLPALACGLAPAPPATSPASRPTAPATLAPYAGTPLPPVGPLPAPVATFAPLAGVLARPVPAIEPPSRAFDALANPDLLGSLSPVAQLALSRQGFVVVPGDASHLYEVYQDAASRGAPVYVTIDALLEASQSLLAAARQDADTLLLDPALRAETAQMVGHAQAQLGAALDGPVQEAAFANLAFFSTAAALLDPAFPVPPTAAQVVADELTLIRGHAGTFISPVFGEPHDYQLYAGLPETGAAIARRWYETHAFATDGGDLERDRRRARQILLMGRALSLAGAEAETWADARATSAFMTGRHPDDLDMADAAAAAAAVYGGWPDPAALRDVGLLDSFGATLGQAAPGTSVRWWPRPWAPADAILPALIFNRVGTYTGPDGRAPFSAVDTAIGAVRGLPHGLDMAAVWGSERALAVLNSAGETAYQGFEAQLGAARAEVAARAPQTAAGALADGWLYALAPLLSSPGPEQDFAVPTAWADRLLTAWTAGWARHGLAPQELLIPGSARNPAPLVPPVPVAGGFVEPQPLVMRRLAALLAQTRQGLDARKILDKDLGERFLRFERFVLELADIAGRQVEGVKAESDSDAALLGRVGDTLEKTGNGAGDRAAAPVAAVATVYANQNTGLALELGMGEAWLLYVIVPVSGQPTLAVGAVFSVYAQRVPIGAGTAQDAWRAAGQRPEPAPWMNSYLAP